MVKDGARRRRRVCLVRVVTVLGTRPEVIKLAPVVRELERAQGVESLVISTGQHRELVDQMLGLFGIEPNVELAVMQPGQLLSDLTGALVRRLGQTLRELEPDVLLVQGDTTSAFCGALAAFYEGILIGHVEAGLRTQRLRSPFPEEANRRLASVVTDFHFCPTPTSAANLGAEGVPASQLYVTGNTVIDALFWAVDQARRLPSAVPSLGRRRVVVTLHRRENHGETMERICTTIRSLAARGDTEVVFPVHPNPAVRAVVNQTLAGVDGVQLCEPLEYLAFVQLLDSAELILTDSGGIQEEAPSLGKPVLVLRDTTERPEAIEAGVARLVGTAPDAVYGAACELLDDPRAYAGMAQAKNPFGDGRAAARIFDVLCDQLGLELAA
jgi:UDP-N-acetylglucosamine 2-epimerase (non-hydrolysing)